MCGTHIYAMRACCIISYYWLYNSDSMYLYVS